MTKDFSAYGMPRLVLARHGMSVAHDDFIEGLFLRSNTMLAWRICEREFALDRSGQGAAREGGRWNRAGTPALYAASTVDLAKREAAQSGVCDSEDAVLV
ncbi:MAG TPA: RES domain-containing protein, partial [Burkholderiaceae bacterium]|nr:RES domain-containing protein [Burkholderiaceae bacterium]